MDFEEFAALLRQSGFSYHEDALGQLFEGYCKFQSMTEAFNRPWDPVTGLAEEFRPEPVS